MWTGLGINYNFDGVPYNPAVDLPYLKSLGYTRIRLLIENWDYSAGVANWKTIFQLALTTGFAEIEFGITFENFNAAQESAHLAAQQSMATFINSQTIPAGTRVVMCIGNEVTNHVTDGSNGSTVMAHYRTVYTAVKAIITNPNIVVTYSMANNEMFNFYNDFHSSGLFYPWDFPSANLYSAPYPNGTLTPSATSFQQNISNAAFWFGISNFVLSEFGPDPSGYSDGAWYDRKFYSEQFVQNLHTAINSGITVAYVYNYLDSQFGCKNTTGLFNPWHYAIRGQRARYTGLV